MTDEDQSWDQASTSYDPNARWLPNPDLDHSGSLNGDVAAVESGPPEFRPVLEGRLFTAHDFILDADCKVHPTARLSYDSLPREYRDVFNNCPMYLEKHLKFVKYLRHLSLDDSDKKNEPSTEKDLIKSLGIPVPTEDKKKWQCGGVGCEYKGTLQHLVSHLRTKSHIGIPTFACSLDCKILFRHSQDRDRHVKDRTCLKARLVQDAEPQGSARSLRGVQDQVPPVTKSKVQSRANQHLEREREYQISAQTSAQSANDPQTRNAVHYDPVFQDPGNGGPGMPSTSFVHLPQAFGTPVHLTQAYNQTQSNVPTTRDGRAGMHPPPHELLTPDFFRTPSILPTNHGGMHATYITNNNHNHIHSPMDNFQPTGNPQFTLGSQPVNPGFNQFTGMTSGYPSLDQHVTTGYGGPAQSSTPHSVNSAGNFCGEDPSRASHRGPRDSRQPPLYVAQNQGHATRMEVYNTRDSHQPRAPPGPQPGYRH